MSKGSHLKNITPEQRKQMQEQAAESRKLKQEWARKNLKLDWEDDAHWRALASKYDYRLPVWYEPCSSKFTNRFLKKMGLSKEWYEEVTGYKNANIEAKENPRLPAYAAVGLLLEAYDEEQTSTDSLKT